MIRRFFDALKMERRYLIFSCSLFVLSSLYGVFFYDQVNMMMKEAGLFNQLEEIAQKIGKTPTFFTAFSTIFSNNITASLFAILSGFVFGIYPMMMLISNGLLLSVALIGSSAQTQIHPIKLFVTTILPHGIFELPAIFIAAALGIRLGMAMIRLVIALFSPKQREKSLEEWKGLGSRALTITFGVVLFLFVAAIVESALIVLMYLNA